MQSTAAYLFADADPTEIAGAAAIDDYPHDCVPWIRSLSPPPSGWLYTGALENHPGLTHELASTPESEGIQAACCAALVP